VKSRFTSFQMEMRILLGNGIEAIITFWQRTCLNFVGALRLYGRLNLKVEH
jgi:hypothetical protein